MLLRFRSNFNKINNRFKENFRLLFGGGKAQIELTYEEESDVQEDEDRDNSFTGIDIAVAPPGKNPRHIGLLSGGEKALTSLALLLSIIQVQRPPFLVLDEVDAALDEVNSFRFAEALEKMAEFTQCIVITHNRETMGKADVLYGVAMGTNGASDIYSVKMEDVAC
jgi:chromosome segregation protein